MAWPRTPFWGVPDEARPGPAMAPRPEGLRWYQIPLSSTRVPRSVIFSYGFQSGLWRYRQLRVLKQLPPPCPKAVARGGLVTPALPPQASLCPRGVCADPCAVSAAPRRSKESPGTRKRVSRGRQPPGPAQPHANRRDVASRGSPACQVAPDRSSHVPVLPEAAVGSLGGEADGGQHTAARMAPQQAGRSSGGHPVGTARGWVSSTDSEDDELIPLKDMLLAGDEPPSPADHQQAACPQPDPLANSLDSLAREKRAAPGSHAAGRPGVGARGRRQLLGVPGRGHRAARGAQVALPAVPGRGSARCPLPTRRRPLARRDFLAHYTMTPRFIPAVHPGEPIFCARSVPVPTLDTRGLKPQSALEGFFFSNSPACQAAFVRDGGLSLLYRCVPTCPLPVLRWLFQLMTLCPDATNASQALWEIWLSTGGEPWCPTAQDVSLAFAHLGADLSPLRRLLPPELCPTDRSLDPSCSPRRASPEATGTLALVTQLGDICKFLALCVVTQPCRYADGARLALVTLLSFLGLDRALRCQPLPELQHLLHCLLEGIRDWQQQLPALCLSLCQLSGHHHNLVALVQLLPDLTSRDSRLRRHKAGRMRLPALTPLATGVRRAPGPPAASRMAPGMAVTGTEAGTGAWARTGPFLTLFPPLTRELRRHLSLRAMSRLLGEPPGTVPPPGAQAEVGAARWDRAGAGAPTAGAGTLTPAFPAAAGAGPAPGAGAAGHPATAGARRGPGEAGGLDQEACYLSYSLLLLASNVVGTENPPAEQRGHLEQLCVQLDRQFGRGLHDSPRLLFRAQLKGLAALLYVKWQEMLGGSPSPLRGVSRAPSGAPRPPPTQ
ncbi:LOW QUALITY PROTEIN: protein FAM178B [Rissa tridactyla]|uniref:LOW QUALITY PROTEIN: protein FAM178B n=1 Tax=Rissa tridactyla TaxID=75485 RepID=UPI0023BAB105|nr:LOW QUALITY PROTEIN: protein FAM178B [Rissa tridactyla]